MSPPISGSMAPPDTGWQREDEAERELPRTQHHICQQVLWLPTPNPFQGRVPTWAISGPWPNPAQSQEPQALLSMGFGVEQEAELSSAVPEDTVASMRTFSPCLHIPVSVPGVLRWCLMSPSQGPINRAALRGDQDPEGGAGELQG